MTRSAHRVLNFYASKSWAILPETLLEMLEIYKGAIDRKSLDQEFDPEAVAAKIGRPLDNTRSVTVRDRVAILPITGPIMRYANIFTEISGATSIELLAQDFDRARNDPSVKAIILEINSPGGEVDGTSELAQQIFNARGEKPIVAYISNLGASAAYWLASACDEIVCGDTASLGSIGVVGGVRLGKDKNLIEFVSSQSPNKRPDPQTESGRAQFQSHVDALADVFIGTVARNRSMSTEDVVNNGGAGGLKVGSHAVDAGLANRVGTLEETISELASIDVVQWRKNVKENAVVETQTGGLMPPPQSTTGAQTMSDETQKTEAEKVEAQKADLDKTIGERITAFFHDKFGASSTSQPPPVDFKAQEKATDENRLAIEKAQSEAEAAKKEAAEAKAQIALLQQNARASGFGQLAKAWPGETAKHVSMLEFLATASEKGEESDLFKDYVTQQSAATEQIKTANLFSEVGSSVPVEGSAAAKFAKRIKEMRADDPKLTEAQAFDKAWQEAPPSLREQYRTEENRTVN